MVVVKAEVEVEKIASGLKKVKIEGEGKKNNANDAKISGEEGNVDKLTPYQGKRRTFGLFICPKCLRRWGSANSWANMGQKCWKCMIMVYPKAQWKLQKKRRPTVLEPGKEHPKSLCEKCATLRHSCRLLARPDDEHDDNDEKEKKKKTNKKNKKKAAPSV